MKNILTLTVLFLATLLTACTRIETGEIGLRRGYDKVIQKTELMPGSFNQTFIGDVLIFPVKEIALPIDKLRPQSSDRSTFDDVDVTILYSINPSMIYKLYSTRSDELHAVNKKEETLLMYKYLQRVANTSTHKAFANYEALQANGSRDAIEASIVKIMTQTLKDEKLDDAITISQAQIRNIQPAASVIESSNKVITQQNELRAKEVEVKTAEAEAKRLHTLAGNPQSIQYMNAKALQDIAEGIKGGKVHAVVVPYDFKGILNVGK
jgi:regulator of protease activity HflC (stomatin/prohibitin superfamily)